MMKTEAFGKGFHFRTIFVDGRKGIVLRIPFVVTGKTEEDDMGKR